MSDRGLNKSTPLITLVQQIDLIVINCNAGAEKQGFASSIVQKSAKRN